MSIKRSDKIAEAIHELISSLLVKGVKDPRIGFTTITAVKVTSDLGLATIFFTVIGDEAEKKMQNRASTAHEGLFAKKLRKPSACAMFRTLFSNTMSQLSMVDTLTPCLMK
jgi:ribosome-binding factor A